MNKVQDEFYKKFNISTKFYTIVNVGDLDNNYQEASANTLQELFEENKFWFDKYIDDIKDFHDWEERYPEITPEKILKLEDVFAGEDGFKLTISRRRDDIDKIFKDCYRYQLYWNNATVSRRVNKIQSAFSRIENICEVLSAIVDIKGYEYLRKDIKQIIEG